MTNNDRLETLTSIASKKDFSNPIIQRFFLQSCARSLLPGERVGVCMKMIAPNKARVEIHKHKETRRTSYKGLVVCGSVWQCPVCASKISEHRRIELDKAVKGWTGGMYLLTYTASHKRGTRLKPFLNSILDSYRLLKSGRWWQEMEEFYGWIGSVRSLEITYGQNGWHPHIHELCFTNNELQPIAIGTLESSLRVRWKDKLKKNNLYANMANGFNLKDGWNDVSDYVAKFGHEPVKNNWSAAAEIAKSVSKKGRLDGRTPLQLLADFSEGDIEAGDLWREYAVTLKGRNQIVWSKGLRETLHVKAETTDEEIAQEITPGSYLLASLTPGQWGAINAMDLRGEVLVKAQRMEDDDFKNWLNGILDAWFNGTLE